MEIELVDHEPAPAAVRIVGGIDGTLFNESPLPTLIVDADSFRVLGVNAAAEERYGYTREQLLSMRMTDLVDPDEPSRAVGSRGTTDDTSGTLLMERHRHRRRDGTVFPVHCASRQFQLGGKRVHMFVVTELSELRALDAEERFTEKMEALARIGGGIAHEFNNLLTAIMATTDLALGAKNVEPALVDDLEKIREAARRASTVTRQLMAFSGSQVMLARPIKVNVLVEQILPLIKHLMPLNVALDVQLRSNHTVEVDPVHLEQVILNLVVNAIEAMPERGLLTVLVEDVTTFATIAIGDNGSGMDEITLARLFEPFHTTKGPGGGRGLGLASVYGAVRQLGGSVDIESRPGQGTQVRLFFPSTLEAAAVETKAPVQSTEPGPAGGEVVLMVEDEANVRAPICRKLRNLGYFVLEANDGEDALRVMQEYHSPIHLVISDVMMPRMDGTQLVGLLRAWYPRLRVLFISGYSPQYLEAQGGKTMSGEAFLAKPFSLDVFAQRVRDVLDTEWTTPDE